MTDPTPDIRVRHTTVSRMTNALVEGATLALAFVVGVIGLPWQAAMAVILAHLAYYLWTRRRALAGLKFPVRILLGLTAGLIVTAAWGLGAGIRLLFAGL
jgi:hypothetical protein